MVILLAPLIVWLCIVEAHASVILSGGPYCITDGGSAQHAVPGTVINITCVVNNTRPGLNVLSWTIPSYGDGVSVTHANGAGAADDDQPEFVSTVNSFDNTEDTTNATLTFTAVSELDGAVVNCADVTESTSNCTLYIFTPPDIPLNLACINVTYDSITLEWDPPADDGGDSVSHYNITRIDSEGSSFITTSTTFKDNILIPNKNNTYIIMANNSYGFGNSIDIPCSTTGQVLNSIRQFKVCLEFGNTTYIAINMTDEDNCPPSSPDINTPPFDNFTVAVSGFDPVYTNSCVFHQPISAEQKYDITITVNNLVGPSEPTTKCFDFQWINNIRFTNDILSYCIVNCTTVEDANVTLSITETGGRTMLTDEQPYNQDYTTFNISSFMTKRSPSMLYNYTLALIAPRATIASIVSELRLSSSSAVSSLTVNSHLLNTSLSISATTSLPSASAPPLTIGIISSVVAGTLLLSVLLIFFVSLIYWFAFKKDKLELAITETIQAHSQSQNILKSSNNAVEKIDSVKMNILSTQKL